MLYTSWQVSVLQKTQEKLLQVPLPLGDGVGGQGVVSLTRHIQANSH